MTMVEQAAMAMHRAVWNYTSPWVYENPKLKEHYCAMAAIAINTFRSCSVTFENWNTAIDLILSEKQEKK